MRALVVAGAVALITASACAPITCQLDHHPERRTVCPPCPTIEDPPPGYCPCATTWQCIEDPAFAERNARERKARNDAVLKAEQQAAARARADSLARAQARSRNAEQLAAAQGNPDGGVCPTGAWLRLTEAGGRTTDGGLSFTEACEALPVSRPPVAPRPAPDEQTVREEAARQERVREAFATALRQCAEGPTCPGKKAPESSWSCQRAEGLMPVTTIACEQLKQMEAPVMLGCPGTWVTRRTCPPLPRPGCRAGPQQCCQPNGAIVGACGPRALAGCVGRSTLCRSEGGWCDPCR